MQGYAASGPQMWAWQSHAPTGIAKAGRLGARSGGRQVGMEVMRSVVISKERVLPLRPVERDSGDPILDRKLEVLGVKRGDGDAGEHGEVLLGAHAAERPAARLGQKLEKGEAAGKRRWISGI